MHNTGSTKVQGDVHFSDPITQASGCPVRAQSQEGHVSHALPRPKLPSVLLVLGVQSQFERVSPALPRSKLLRFPGVVWRPSPSWAMHLLLFPGPRSPDSPVICRGTVSGGFFVSCTSKAQADHLSGCSMNAQSQLSQASPALPRPKWLGVLPKHSPRWALCLMHFPGPSCSGTRMFQSTLFQRATEDLRIAVMS